MILEKDIQAKIKKQLERSGWLVIKLIQTSLNGIPDLLCIRDGESVFIEVKRPGGKVSPLQTYRIEQLKSKHIQVLIAQSTKDTDHLCQISSLKQQKNIQPITSQLSLPITPNGPSSRGKNIKAGS